MRWDWDFIRGRRTDFNKALLGENGGVRPEIKMVCINGVGHPMQEQHLSDMEVAGQVRMLHRRQLDHERVCTLARDRIVYLADRLGELEDREKQGFRALPVCSVSGRVAGDPHACGDCDPCGAAALVPDVVKSLIKERDEWADKYAGAMMEIDDLSSRARCSKGTEGAEPVAWRIRVRQRSATFYSYTERLPFDPDPDEKIVILGEPEPLYAHPAASAAEGEKEFVEETCFDCGVREPCDEDCPNHVEPEIPAPEAPATREGELREALEEIAHFADLPDNDHDERASGEEVEYADGHLAGLRKAGRMARAALTANQPPASLAAEYELATPTHYRPDAADEEDCPPRSDAVTADLISRLKAFQEHFWVHHPQMAWKRTTCDDGIEMVHHDGDTIFFGDANHQEPNDRERFDLIVELANSVPQIIAALSPDQGRPA